MFVAYSGYAIITWKKKEVEKPAGIAEDSK
jgi:hypothetical protein